MTGVQVQVDNRSTVEIDCEAVAGLAAAALERLGFASGELGILFVPPGEISELNREHLGRSGSTDVISFPIDAGDEAAAAGGPPPLLGDVVICPEVAAEQSREHGTGTAGEICLLVIHGLLHIAGYDHEADDGEMDAEQSALYSDLCGEIQDS